MSKRHVLLLLCLVIPGQVSSTGLACTKNVECSTIVQGDSECVDGFCSNPFYRDGCLGSKIPGWNKARVCNSDDPQDAEEKGYCRHAPLDYMEVRALAQDWETSVVSAWVLQILLNEVVDVPASMESSQKGVASDFYDPYARFEYGSPSGVWEELTLGSKVRDCRTVKDSETYTPCANFASEVWHAGLTNTYIGGVESPMDLGAQGADQLFIPRFLARQDPTLVSYAGLEGEHNRRKLAETFKRPTTWKQYCEEVSLTNCTIDDGVATRRPLDDFEEESLFAEGAYIGHFRATEENDCDKFPDTCTGHIADFPCHWRTYVKPQTHHLNIALNGSGPLANSGYESYKLVQIWRAANATRSPVIALWFYPTVAYSEFVRTDAEFTRVVLPPPTSECVAARVAKKSSCYDDFDAMVGDPEGSCDTYPEPLRKLVAKGVRESSKDPGKPEALWSPAYDVLSSFKITELQYGEIFDNYLKHQGHGWSSFGLRNATCQWVAENLDDLRRFVPETFPRVVDPVNTMSTLPFVIASSIATVTVLVAIVSVIASFAKRHTKAMYYIQMEYISLLNGGLLLVSVGALLMVVPPTDATCTATVWFTNIGYVMQYVPLMVRISAIDKLSTSGKHMHRVRLRIGALVQKVILATVVIGAFLIAWTIVDSPTKLSEYEMTSGTNSMGERIVSESDYCGSDSDSWAIVSFSWQICVLLPTVVVAYMASQVVEDLNDTKSMATMLFMRLLFAVLKAATISLVTEDLRTEAMAYTSLVLSADTMTTLAIYIIPKYIKSAEELGTEILPDLFVNTTIMLADVDGFTAWSSAREPVQVFHFLEYLHEELDTLAERRQVFKVETTGGRYVAAAGVPEARSDHAVVMARFALESIRKTEKLCKRLEAKFGPDTVDLSLQVGLHSGPVTGGFLKGKHSRFQLFGDTMTTTYLIHESGESNQVHISAECANCLFLHGRKSWVVARDMKVHTSQKGELQTYWLKRNSKHGQIELTSSNKSDGSSLGSDDDDSVHGFDTEKRWVEWNTEILRRLLLQIAARRQDKSALFIPGATNGVVSTLSTEEGRTPLDEVKEIIELPGFDREAAKRQQGHGKVSIPPDVVQQLHEFIEKIAALYNPNPFHNFAHASYVVMAVTKYMNRIIAASEIDVGVDEGRFRSSTQEAIHDHTYGITSDPLTQFACVFSAVIHDVDHRGVPNTQLIEENQTLAAMYNSRSVAEQNSLDLAWELLMEPQYQSLRSYLCRDEAELRRFRQLVVNGVMATDLGDSELKGLRNARWAKAFDRERALDANVVQSTNRKATIVIEHLIQAADVAHTCQHWAMFRKWNERLFHECYVAFRKGRAEKNPADYWYQSEIGFFDFYVIPLSKKLRDCGVFGPTSDENLVYAQSNRATWEKKGEAIVSEMLAKYERQYEESEGN